MPAQDSLRQVHERLRFVLHLDLSYEFDWGGGAGFL
jgi:hypothetical protein